jgi:cytosine/adenosine deaminase-related metal-dependent hydrolase
MAATLPPPGRATLVVTGARVLDPLEPAARPAARDVFVADGMVIALAPAGTVPVPPGARVVDGRRHLAIPGLVSAHYHSHDTLMKGCFGPTPLETWLIHATPPNYPRRSKAELRARVLIGALESLKSGTTTVQDMATVFPLVSEDVDTILDAYDEIGIRCVFAAQVADASGERGVPFWDELIPPALRTTTTRSAGRARELATLLRDELDRNAGRHPLVTWGLGPSTPESCSDAFLEALAALSAERDLPVFTHVYESKANAINARRHYGADGGSLVRYLARVGLLNERLTMAHSVWLTQAEVDATAAAGAHVALNPVCNLKSKSGVAPIAAYVGAGVKIGLGTDNSSLSDVQSLFQSMKMFVLLSAAGNPHGEGASALEAFRAATVGSADAVGLGGRVGRIAPGMRADITLVTLDDPSFVPLNDAVRQLVFTEPGRGVRTVIVDGRVVIDQGRCTTVDEAALYAEIEDLMPALERDLEAVRARNAPLAPYIAEAHGRIVAADVGLDRFVAGPPDLVRNPAR